ncbi:unnamed protein product, partial [Prorocentrum cordatum]
LLLLLLLLLLLPICAPPRSACSTGQRPPREPRGAVGPQEASPRAGPPPPLREAASASEGAPQPGRRGPQPAQAGVQAGAQASALEAWSASGVEWAAACACGQAFPDEARFCIQCGSKRQWRQPAIHCGECRTAYDPGDLFCRSCGAGRSS